MAPVAHWSPPMRTTVGAIWRCSNGVCKLRLDWQRDPIYKPLIKKFGDPYALVLLSGNAGVARMTDLVDDPSAEMPPKVERPHAHFTQPGEVVVDHSLTKDEKVHALETMEQDARQLGAASSEGMAGGEDNRLHEVLAAKDAMKLPPGDVAIAVVMQDLRGKLPGTEGTAAHRVIEHAIEALGAARDALAQPTAVRDAKAEVETELAMEKLDP